MAKNKAKVASKSRKSALRIEALEQRQLLATVTGAGTQFENLSNPLNPGILYDQVLMTGSTVTVTADAGQVTRVSFLDMQGDIVQAEFAGRGTMTVTLTNPNDPSGNIGAAAAPANYNQPGVSYVQGLAQFTIQGSDANTNFNVFSVGSATAVNQGLFAGGKTGGNNTADVAVLRIVNNPENPGGFSTFGRIGAGNAVFAASTGTVGIAAAGVNVQGPVIIGDLDASASGVPTLNFGGASQFGTLTVAGGDLVQSNAVPINDAGFTSVNSTAGTTSAGVTVASKVVDATAAGLAASVTTIDTLSAVDITGKTQAEIEAIFDGRTFTNAVTVTGDLGVAQSIEAAEFKNGVTFKGDVLGTVTVDRDVASITAEKSIQGAVTIGGNLGNVTVGAGLSQSGLIKADRIGNVTITGNIANSAGLSTDQNDNNAYDEGEGRIGNVSVSGNISNSAYVEGILGIGNISVGGNVTASNTTQAGVFITRSGGAGSGDAFLANIGTVTVGGDVDMGDNHSVAGGNFINIGTNGVWGNVTINGTGSSSGATQIGKFNMGGTTTGGSSIKTGTITIAETSSDVSWGGLAVSAGTGGVGAVTITGAGTTSADYTQAGAATYTGVSGDGITIGGFLTADFNAGIGIRGATNVTTVAGNSTTPSLVTIDATWGSNGTDHGGITINAGTANSTIDFNADISADDLGNVTLTAGAIDMSAGFGLLNDETAGAITINGALTLSNSAIDLAKGVSSLTVAGKTTLGAGTNISTGSVSGAVTLQDVTAVAGSVVRFKGDVGSLVLNGTTNLAAANTATFVLDNDGSGTDDLGSLTINGKVTGTGGTTTVDLTPDITASSIGNVTITGGLAQDEVLITNFGILAAPNADTGDATKAEQVIIDGSNLGNYGIGNISIATDLSLAFTGTSIFRGDNTFVALGKIGDISISGDTAGAQQSKLFAAGTDGAWFAAGDTDGLVGNVTAFGNFNSGSNIARDTSGNVVDLSTTPTLITGGTVSIGNISVTALQTNITQGYSGVNGISGGDDTDSASTSGIEGFAVLSGVRVATNDPDLIDLAAATVTTINAAAIDADLGGTIGNILIASNNAVGFRDEVPNATGAGGTLAGDTDDAISAIIAKTSVGTQQSVSGSSTSTSDTAIIIGDVDALADDMVEDADATNQIVVVVL